MRERNHIVRVHLNDREMAHLEKCLSKTHWGKEAFLRAAILGTGIATKPPEDCRKILDCPQNIGDRLNNIPVFAANFTATEREQIQSATTEIWRLYNLVQDAFLPAHKYHMKTMIQKGDYEKR